MAEPEAHLRRQRRTMRTLLVAATLAAACAPAISPGHAARSAIPAPARSAPVPTPPPRPAAVDTAIWSKTETGLLVGVRRFTVFGALSPAMLDTEIHLALDRRARITWLDGETARVASDAGTTLVRIAGSELSLAEADCVSAACDAALATELRRSEAGATGERRYLTLGSDLSVALPAGWRVLDPRSGGTLLRDSEALGPELRSAVAARVGFSLDPGDPYYPPASLLLYAVATKPGLEGDEVALDMTLRRYDRGPGQTIDTFAASAPSHLAVRRVTTPAGQALEVARRDGPRSELDHIFFIGESSYLFRFSASARTTPDADALRRIAGSLVTTTMLVSPSDTP